MSEGEQHVKLLKGIRLIKEAFKELEDENLGLVEEMGELNQGLGAKLSVAEVVEMINYSQPFNVKQAEGALKKLLKKAKKQGYRQRRGRTYEKTN